MFHLGRDTGKKIDAINCHYLAVSFFTVIVYACCVFRLSSRFTGDVDAYDDSSRFRKPSTG
jgi:hypothetical protein